MWGITGGPEQSSGARKFYRAIWYQIMPWILPVRHRFMAATIGLASCQLHRSKPHVQAFVTSCSINIGATVPFGANFSARVLVILIQLQKPQRRFCHANGPPIPAPARATSPPARKRGTTSSARNSLMAVKPITSSRRWPGRAKSTTSSPSLA